MNKLISILIVLIAVNAHAYVDVQELPKLGVTANYDDSTGVLEISKNKIQFLSLYLGTGLYGNTSIVSSLQNENVFLYENSGNALIVEAGPTSLILLSNTKLSSPSGYGVAGPQDEGFSYFTSPNGKIRVAIFRYNYRRGSFVSPERAVLSSLSPVCDSIVAKTLDPRNRVDIKWAKASKTLSDFLIANEVSCEGNALTVSEP